MTKAYSESYRGQLERDLTNKRELIQERRNGLIINIYWLRLTNQVSLMLIDDQDNKAYEQIIPNDKVLDARDHPYSYLFDENHAPNYGVET